MSFFFFEGFYHTLDVCGGLGSNHCCVKIILKWLGASIFTESEMAQFIIIIFLQNHFLLCFIGTMKKLIIQPRWLCIYQKTHVVVVLLD